MRAIGVESDIEDTKRIGKYTKERTRPILIKVTKGNTRGDF